MWSVAKAASGAAVLLPYLRPVLTGLKAWDANETVQRAIEIRDGVNQNPRILSFQHRSST